MCVAGIDLRARIDVGGVEWLKSRRATIVATFFVANFWRAIAVNSMSRDESLQTSLLSQIYMLP